MISRPKMIFHAPYVLKQDAASASGIRPQKMLQAFKNIGFEVIEVTGTHTERRNRIRSLRRQINRGMEIEFLYSESATVPLGLGEPVTRHTSLTRDTSFLRFCERKGIPGGVFYRDVYWRFPVYKEAVKWPLSVILRLLYRWDLFKYKRARVTVYLPSLQMAEWVPIIPSERFRALPPGTEIQELQSRQEVRKLSLLYVGGLGDYYRLHETVRQISNRSDVELIICTRAAEWEQRQHEYEALLAGNIQVFHLSGENLRELYHRADICVLAFEPIAYRQFAVPMKMFEYLGYGKPIVVSDGTFASEFVIENKIGWSVPYDSSSLTDLLESLAADQREVANVTKQAISVREGHTWEARAQQVAEHLKIQAPR